MEHAVIQACQEVLQPELPPEWPLSPEGGPASGVQTWFCLWGTLGWHCWLLS